MKKYIIIVLGAEHFLAHDDEAHPTLEAANRAAERFLHNKIALYPHVLAELDFKILEIEVGQVWPEGETP